MDRKATELLRQPKVIGLRQVMRGFRDCQIRCVLAAADADGHILRELKSQCALNGVELIMLPSMEELGREVGIDVGCAAVGILK